MGVVDLIEQDINVFIIGEFGIGKTHFLNRLSKKYNTPVFTKNPGLKELEEFMNERFKSKKEAFNHLLKQEKRLLIFDDVHNARKDTINYIIRLSREHVVVCAGEEVPEKVRFDFYEVKLRRLNHEESMNLCRKLCKDDKVCERICRVSKGLPLLIIRGFEHYQVTGVVKKYYEVDWKKLLFAKVTVFAYFCLSIRYFARHYHNWEVYSALSSIAYLLLAFNRFGKRL